MAIDPDTGIREGDQFGKTGPGEDQHDYTHSDSGNSGGSKTTEGGPGTAGSVPERKPGDTGGAQAAGPGGGRSLQRRLPFPRRRAEVLGDTVEPRGLALP